MPEMAVLLLVLHLGVGDGGLAAGAPVHQAVAPVHQALFIQPAEGFPHRPGAAFVHGEAFPAPVAAHAHAPLLVHNASAVLVLPLPSPLQEGFPADAVLGQAFLGHGLHNLHFRGDGRVVRARQPQGRVALHAMVANGRVLQGAVHGVTHVQLAGDVGRRHHNGKGFLARHPMRRKSPARLPCLINVVLNGLRIEFCFHFRAVFLRFHAHNSPSLADDVQ